MWRIVASDDKCSMLFLWLCIPSNSRVCCSLILEVIFSELLPSTAEVLLVAALFGKAGIVSQCWCWSSIQSVISCMKDRLIPPQNYKTFRRDISVSAITVGTSSLSDFESVRLKCYRTCCRCQHEKWYRSVQTLWKSTLQYHLLKQRNHKSVCVRALHWFLH